MASQYESYKVRELVTAYRSDPTMFTDDQLDQLESLAYDNGISFKRINSEFNLNRAVRQAFAGAVEGFTTFDLMTEKPRNTGEAIFRQIGHLVGFAPGIAKAPILAASKVAQKVTGSQTRNRFTQAALDHIDVFHAKSIPMQFSKAGKMGLDDVLTKTGADSASFLKQGSVGRQIADEAVGLAFASGVSNIWKGEDAVLDGFIGGAIAGGAFGGIGNFVSVGNLYKGSPQQVERANQMLRAGVGSMVTGLPSTLADEPTEMQIYNYLLGGFFGYNSRPAVDKESSKWLDKIRDPKENFRPEESKDYNDISKEAQWHIVYEHPMGYESSQGEAGGSSGVALKYLRNKAKQNGQNIDFRQEAINHFERNELDYNEIDILDFYRSKAMELYEVGRNDIKNAVTFKTNVYNNDQVDQMDTVQRDLFSLRDTSKKIFNKTDKFETSVDVAQTIKNTFEQSNNDIEIFRDNIKNAFGDAIDRSTEKALTQYFIDSSNIMQPIELPYLMGKNARLRTVENEKIGDTTIREKAPILPIQKFLPNANITYMTHAVLPSADGNKAVKILGQKLEDGEITYDLDQNDLGLLNDLLASKNRYTYGANKDKLNVFNSDFRDDNYTLDDIFNILSRSGRSLEELQKDYDDSLKLEYKIFGENENVANIFRRKFISNVVNDTEIEGLPVEEAYRFLQEDSPYYKDVVDFNKRIQLATTRMFYMTPSSFKDVADTGQGQTYNIILTNDTDVANTDGGGLVRNDFMDARNNSMSLNPNITGADKPVTFHKTPNGVYAQKSAGFRAYPALEEFMKKNKIHEVVYTSSSKRKGTLPLTELSYGKDGKWSSDDVQLITIPITSLQISSGTYENTNKDTKKGQDLPIQFYGQINNTQAPGFRDIFFEKVLNPSFRGTEESIELINKFKNKELDVEGFAKEFVENKIDLSELPLEFAKDKLINNPSNPESIFLSDRLMKAESNFELDEDINETFDLDNDSSYADHHSENESLSYATRGTHVPRITLSFIKNNYQNALRKYFTKRITNPRYKYASKSWIEPFESKEVVQYIEFDPFKKGDRSIKYGEIYLNDGHRQMPVVFRNKEYTLGELWSKYTGAFSKGLSKEELAEYDEAFTFLTIRTPADSISGIRAVRFRGWTNQKGAGSLLHPTDKEYSGGADHDSDSIKIFQGLGNELIGHYKRNADERSHWVTDKDYLDGLNDLFTNKDMPQELKDGFNNKFNIFSPSYRFLAGRNSSTGKNGLGFGLSGKGYLMNLYDYVVSNGGSIEDGALIIRAKDKKSFREFLDQGTMIVNKSADASKDPTILQYNKHRDILFNSLFQVTTGKENKTINTYGEFISYTKPAINDVDRAKKVSAIIDTVRLSKPRQTTYNEDGTSRAKGLFEYIKELNEVNNVLGEQDIDQVYPSINKEIQKVFEDGLSFGELKKVQQILYRKTKQNYINNTSGLLKKGKPKQFLPDSKLAEYLEKHFDILGKEISFSSEKYFQDTLNTDPNQALDIFGKDLGQYATMELLTKQFVDVQNAFTGKGRVVNVVDDVFPNVKEKAFEIKDQVSEVMNHPERDNAMNLDIESRIQGVLGRLQDIERANGIQEGLLQDYFSYWLLSPIRRNITPDRAATPQFYKILHSSRSIPMRPKRNFYNKMDEIYNRANTGDDKPIRIGNIKKVSNEILKTNSKPFETMNALVKKGGLEKIAYTDKDLIEVRKLQDLIKTNPAGVDFNNWFINYTLALEGNPRDSTTITMTDVMNINRHLKEIDSVKALPVYLRHWHTSPMTIEREMVKMNFLTRAKKVTRIVDTARGKRNMEFYKVMSPMESIRNAVNDMDISINAFNNKKLKTIEPLERVLNNISARPNIKNKYIENLIEFREGRLMLDQIDKSINKDKFLKLNSAVTEFFKKSWNDFVATKDISGRNIQWDRIDKEHDYGKLNNYIQYDKNGKFNIKLFEDKVMNAKQTEQLVRAVGIDGLMRFNYEYRLEQLVKDKNPKDPKKFRESRRASNPFVPRRKRDFDTYVHHSIRNVNEKILLEQARWMNKQIDLDKNFGKGKKIPRDLALDNPFFNINDRIAIGEDYEIAFEKSSGSYASPLKKRGDDPIPFKKNTEIFNDYQDALIKGYFRNLTKFKAQGDLDAFLMNMKDYVPSRNEKKKFVKLYKGVELTEIPAKQRYNNYVDVWADLLRTYAETAMGYQTTFSSKQMTPQGKKLLHLNKYNLFYITSDQFVAGKLERMYKSKLFAGKDTIPFLDKKLIPKDPETRQLYYYNLIRNFGAMEAKYQLMSLLFNTGSYATNIFGGTAQTTAYAGFENVKDSGNIKAVTKLLLTDRNGVNKVFLNNGKPVTTMKEISTWLEENGYYDNYLQNEFDFNPELKTRLRDLGHNFKDFKRDMLIALKSKKGNRDESVTDVMKKYGVKETLEKTGGFFMQESERFNRKKAFLASAMQYVKGVGRLGKDLTIADDQVIEHAMNGIRMSQYMYQNSERPLFMATSTGKVFSRFKLFAFNSVRIRKEFYRQAKELGMNPNTEEYKRFERQAVIDLWMYMLGAAFMFSLFDTALPPPYDWIQSLSDYVFGTKNQKEMAYFNDPLGPLSILKPPIARIPEAAGELLTGNFDEFTDYTMYTLLPFGRGIRQAVQLSDDGVGKGLERAPEILFRIPYNKFLNRIERAKKDKRRASFVDELLEVS